MTQSTKQTIIRAYGWILKPGRRYTWPQFANLIEARFGNLAIPKLVAEQLKGESVNDVFMVKGMFDHEELLR